MILDQSWMIAIIFCKKKVVHGVMSDFDHLIEDAENFQEEEDVDDDFVAEYNNEVNNKKRASVEVDSVAVKKAKPPGYLADYFVDTPQSFAPKPNDSVKGNYSQFSENRSNEGNSQPVEREAPPSEKGPNCMCGIGSVSKTTLKEGPNKNRMFWVSVGRHLLMP